MEKTQVTLTASRRSAFIEGNNKFRQLEGTMNSTSTIHPPPDMSLYYKELGIDDLIQDQTANINTRSVTPEVGLSQPTSTQTPAAQHGGIFGRFSRGVTSIFRNHTFGNSGKRKREDEAIAAMQQSQQPDNRKAEVEAAYAEAKRLGLLPEAKVYTRPVRQARKIRTTTSTPIASPIPSPGVQTPGEQTPGIQTPGVQTPGTQTPGVQTPGAITPGAHTPRLRTTSMSMPSLRTPSLSRSLSKRDLNKQAKLKKKVTDLEQKLNKTKAQLDEALNKENAESTYQYSISMHENTYIAVPTDDDSEIGTPRGTKRKANRASTATEVSVGSTRKAPTSPHKRLRLSKRRSLVRKESRDDIVMVVPDGVDVPLIPTIPAEVEGTRVQVSDDGFGGLGHEIF